MAFFLIEQNYCLESSNFLGRNGVSCENVTQEALSSLLFHFATRRFKRWGTVSFLYFLKTRLVLLNISQGNAGPQSALAVRWHGLVGWQRAWELRGCEFYSPSSTPSPKPSGSVKNLSSHTYIEETTRGGGSEWGSMQTQRPQEEGLQAPSVLVGGHHADTTGQTQGLNRSFVLSDRWGFLLK